MTAKPESNVVPENVPKRLNLCLDHKQEWKQSHYAKHNCDYCKLEVSLAEANRRVELLTQAHERSLAEALRLAAELRKYEPGSPMILNKQLEGGRDGE